MLNHPSHEVPPALLSYPEPPQRCPGATALPAHLKVRVSDLCTGALSGVTGGGAPVRPSMVFDPLGFFRISHALLFRLHDGLKKWGVWVATSG